MALQTGFERQNAGRGLPEGSLRRPRGPESGTTFIELMVVMTILVMVVSIFYQMVVSTSGLRHTNHENAIAAEAARVVIERMRNQPFDRVYALYNGDPEDDPAGAGTGPGHRFPVDGLDPVDGAEFVGEIVFPSAEQAPDQLEPPEVEPAPWDLREDYTNEALGMPRDLNGDSVIDELDHRDDYILLPVRIHLEWRGKAGDRRFDLYTQLANVKKSS